MKKVTTLTTCCAALLACTSTFGYPNPIEGGTPATVTNDWHVAAPWLMVGANSGNNSLAVVDGAQVFNQIGYLGYTVNSSGNSALVTGGGSLWNNSQELSVGYLGVSNNLTVANGGAVTTPNAYIGNLSNDNLATVTGVGSLLDATILNVGHQGDGNRLLGTDGATVESAIGTIGYWINSDNNVATIQSNGAWNSSTGLNVGGYGSGNQLIVGAGGRVESPVVNLGLSTLSSSNLVTVSGNGSVLHAPELNIGGTAMIAGGTGNRVEVSSGGRVETTDLTIHAGNNLDLNNDGTFAINNDFNASMNGFTWNDGGHLSLTGSLSGMPVMSENNMTDISVLDGVGKTLTLNGGSWSNTALSRGIGWNGSGNTSFVANGGSMHSLAGYIGFNSSASNNTVQIAGEGSQWNNTYSLTVGDAGSGNSLYVSAGGRLTSSYGTIGDDAGANGNSVYVDGSNSVWEADWITVGADGSGNLMQITDGGIVHGSGGTIGAHSGSDSNAVLVSGSGSRWDNDGNLFIGTRGSDNMLMIENGGLVESRYGRIGYEWGGGNNSVVVQGEGSRWINTQELRIGVAGNGSRLAILDGGYVENHWGQLGVGSYDSHGNSVIVSGSNSMWKNNYHLSIGGSENKLFILDGGRVENDMGSLGGRDNHVMVDGQNSIWHNHGTMNLGGVSNSLTVSGGALVSNGMGYIGEEHSHTDNQVVIEGAGTQWNNASSLYIGRRGRRNTMQVLDGALVNSRSSYIGRYAGADSNAVFVAGDGSMWRIDGGLSIGSSGRGNSLSMQDGGWVFVGDVDTNNLPNIGTSGGLAVGDATGNPELVAANQSVIDTGYAYIGLFSNESGSVTLTGDSEMVARNGLIVGVAGANNRMTVSDGAVLDAGTGIIGLNNTAISNVVNITGGSWSNAGSLVVGMAGSNNGLSITDGGAVTSLETIVGAASSNNAVLVSGPGSTLTSDNLYVGYEGSDNTLTIESGGAVVSSNSTIGYAASAGGNSATVSGGTWNNAGTLVVGNAGGNNELSITDGGLVESADGVIGNYSANNAAVVSGVGSAWNNLGSLTVGNMGAGNSLSITNGGRVASSSGYIGYNATAIGNEVLVSGAGSVWDNSGDLYVGYEGSGNTLRIADGGLVMNENGFISTRGNAVFVTGVGSEWRNAGDLHLSGGLLSVDKEGLVSVGRDLQNRNGSNIRVDPGSRVNVGGDYYQDSSSKLYFGVETDAAGAPTNALVTVAGTAEFEKGAKIEYASNIGRLKFNTFYTNKIVEAKKLIVAGDKNVDSLDLEKLDASGTLVDVLFWENDQDIYALVGRRYLADSAGFKPGTMMGRLTKEIDDLSLLGNSTFNGMINLLNTMSGHQQNVQLTQLFTQGVPTYMHSRAMHGGQQQVLAHTRAFRSGSKPGTTPTNATASDENSPEKVVDTDHEGHSLRGWMRGYGSWADREAPRPFSGFEQSVYGSVIGMDKAIGSVLIGGAGGYARSNLNQDNYDSSDAWTRYGILYATFAGEEWFGDINLSYGRSRIETRSGTVFAAEGKSDAENYTMYIGGGKDIHLSGGGLIFTPEASLFIDYFDQDSYSDGYRDIDAYDRWSYQSRLGAALSLKKQVGEIVFKPELHAYWLHEFNTDTDQVGYSLTGGTGRYAFSMQAPDEDILEAGVGISTLFNDRLELMLGVDGQFSDRYEAVRASGRISFDF